MCVKKLLCDWFDWNSCVDCVIAANTNNVGGTGGHGDQHQVVASKESTPAVDQPKQQREGKQRNPRPPPSRRANDTKPKESLVNGTTA